MPLNVNLFNLQTVCKNAILLMSGFTTLEKRFQIEGVRLIKKV